MDNSEMGYPVKNVPTTTTTRDRGSEDGGSSSRKGIGGFVDSFKPAPAFAHVKPSGKITADGDADSADVQQADQLSQGGCWFVCGARVAFRRSCVSTTIKKIAAPSSH
jgi:hypothetical protein